MLENLGEKGINNLVEAILSLKDKSECYNFLEDLCTVAEVKAMAQRLEVAKMLEERVVYSDIVKKTGASTATISRVNRAINYGYGGYKTVLERIAPENNGEKADE